MLLNAIVYFALYLLVLNLWDSYKNKGEVARLLGGLRPRHFAWAVLTLVSALVALVALSLLGPEWFQWGWYKALTGQANGTALVPGASAKHAIPGFLIATLYVLLLCAMPFMVLVEERAFRRGAEGRGWVANGVLAVLFGLAHMVVGLPVFAALALTAPAVIFTLVYLRAFRRHRDRAEATLESSRAHLAHNLLAVGAAATAFAVA